MNTIAGLDIAKVAKETGTPAYLYDKNQIKINYQRFLKAFNSHYENVHIHYAVKANSNLHILKTIEELGSGVDCSSPGEIYLAMKAGFSKDKISYTGNYESPDDLAYALEKQVHINLDDIGSYQRIKKIRIPERIAFRINPGIGKGAFKGIVTGGADAKFGIPFEHAFTANEMAKNDGVKRFGIHMMTGSNNREPEYFEEIVIKLMDIAGDIFGRLDIKPEFVNIGGGFGVPYRAEENELDIEKTGRLVTTVFKEKCKEYGFDGCELHIEPGRYLVANCGYLLSSVTGVKNAYKKFVGLNVGMTTLIRPALYGAYHHPSVYGKDENTQTIQLCGNICENSDIFLRDIQFPDVKEGDLVIFRDVGAYGFVMTSTYNTRLRPAEYLIEDGRLRMIRRAEQFEDLLSHIVE